MNLNPQVDTERPFLGGYYLISTRTNQVRGWVCVRRGQSRREGFVLDGRAAKQHLSLPSPSLALYVCYSWLTLRLERMFRFAYLLLL